MLFVKIKQATAHCTTIEFCLFFCVDETTFFVRLRGESTKKKTASLAYSSTKKKQMIILLDPVDSFDRTQQR